MSHYIGGSAPAMARQISNGFTLVNAVMLRRFAVSELKALQFEIERKLRDLRGEPMDLSDLPSIQARNRRLTRLESALRVVRATADSRRRTGG